MGPRNTRKDAKGDERCGLGAAVTSRDPTLNAVATAKAGAFAYHISDRRSLSRVTGHWPGTTAAPSEPQARQDPKRARTSLESLPSGPIPIAATRNSGLSCTGGTRELAEEDRLKKEEVCRYAIRKGRKTWTKWMKHHQNPAMTQLRRQSKVCVLLSA